MHAYAMVYDTAGLTGPLRNMLFSSKPESICDVLIKVREGKRVIGSVLGGLRVVHEVCILRGIPAAAVYNNTSVVLGRL